MPSESVIVTYSAWARKEVNNIKTMNMYGVKKIVTTCPHCFNILKNEYPALGGNYEVTHHTKFLQDLIKAFKNFSLDSLVTNIRHLLLEEHFHLDDCALNRISQVNILCLPRNKCRVFIAWRNTFFNHRQSGQRQRKTPSLKFWWRQDWNFTPSAVSSSPSGFLLARRAFAFKHVWSVRRDAVRRVKPILPLFHTTLFQSCSNAIRTTSRKIFHPSCWYLIP